MKVWLVLAMILHVESSFDPVYRVKRYQVAPINIYDRSFPFSKVVSAERSSENSRYICGIQLFSLPSNRWSVIRRELVLVSSKIFSAAMNIRKFLATAGNRGRAVPCHGADVRRKIKEYTVVVSQSVKMQKKVNLMRQMCGWAWTNIEKRDWVFFRSNFLRPNWLKNREIFYIMEQDNEWTYWKLLKSLSRNNIANVFQWQNYYYDFIVVFVGR